MQTGTEGTLETIFHDKLKALSSETLFHSPVSVPFTNNGWIIYLDQGLFIEASEGCRKFSTEGARYSGPKGLQAKRMILPLRCYLKIRNLS